MYGTSAQNVSVYLHKPQKPLMIMVPKKNTQPRPVTLRNVLSFLVGTFQQAYLPLIHMDPGCYDLDLSLILGLRDQIQRLVTCSVSKKTHSQESKQFI